MDVNIVPARKMLCHLRIEDRVRMLDAAEGLVAEDDAETKGVVRRVALPHGDIQCRVEGLRQRGEVQTRGTAADDCNAHPLVLLLVEPVQVCSIRDDSQVNDIWKSTSITRSQMPCGHRCGV